MYFYIQEGKLTSCMQFCDALDRAESFVVEEVDAEEGWYDYVAGYFTEEEMAQVKNHFPEVDIDAVREHRKIVNGIN